jgi:hypothetical protein
MVKRLFLTGVALVVFAVFATSATALTNPKLSFVKGGGATIGWSNEGGSSPGDTTGNHQSLRIAVPAGGGASAYTYGPSETLVGIRGRSLSQIDHLGFDSKGYLGAGAPRISLGTTGDDGNHTYFLSAFYCNVDAGSGWRTSDFIHDPNCVIYRDGVTPYTGWAAVAAVADANHEVVQSTPNDWFLIVDEPTADQGGSSLTYVDRLTVQDWAWVRGGKTGALNCNTTTCI